MFLDEKVPLISIIVPVFNTEQYLDCCIDSIVNQSFSNLDIILVNDGSSDQSGSICDEWQKKDSRIRVIHKTNEGVTIARKVGVENSRGEWICFVDSDDTIPNNATQILASHIRDGIDVIHGIMEIVGGKEQLHPNFGEKNTIEYLKILLKYKAYWGSPAQLIRSSILDSYAFDIPSVITIGEDFLMNIRFAQNARTVVLLPDVVYNYIWRPTSAMSNLSRLDKNYRKIYINTFYTSILPKYKNELRGALIRFRIRRSWRLLKMKIKKYLLHG